MKKNSKQRYSTLIHVLLLSLVFISYPAIFTACSKSKKDEKTTTIKESQTTNTSKSLMFETNDTPTQDSPPALNPKSYEAPVKRIPTPRNYQTLRAEKRNNPLLAYVPRTSFIVIASSAQLPIQSPQAEDFLNHLSYQLGEMVKRWPKANTAQVRALQSFLSASLKSLSPHKLAALGLADGKLGDFVFYVDDKTPVFKFSLSNSPKFQKLFDSYLKRENIDLQMEKVSGIDWQLIELPQPYQGYLAVQWGQTLTMTLINNPAQSKQQLARLSSPSPPNEPNNTKRFENFVKRDDLFAFVSIDFDSLIDNFVGITNHLRTFISPDVVKISPSCIKDLRFLAKLIPSLSIEISAFTGGPALGFKSQWDVEIGDQNILRQISEIRGKQRPMPHKTYLPVAQIYASVDMPKFLKILEDGKHLLKQQNISCSKLTKLNDLIDFDIENYPKLKSLAHERFDLAATIYEGSIKTPKQLAIYLQAENAANIAQNMAWIEITESPSKGPNRTLALDHEDDEDNADGDENNEALENHAQVDGENDEEVGETLENHAQVDDENGIDDEAIENHAQVDDENGIDDEALENHAPIVQEDVSPKHIDSSNAKLSSQAMQRTNFKTSPLLQIREDLVLISSSEGLLKELNDSPSQNTKSLVQLSISERGYTQDYDTTRDYHLILKLENFDMGIRGILQYTLE